MTSEKGFSLIEVVVALGVFSLGVLGLMRAGSQSLATGRDVEARFLARIVAENVLADALIDPNPVVLGVSEGDETQMGRDYRWRRIISESPRQGLAIIEVEVTAASSESPTIARLRTLKAIVQ